MTIPASPFAHASAGVPLNGSDGGPERARDETGADDVMGTGTAPLVTSWVASGPPVPPAFVIAPVTACPAFEYANAPAPTRMMIPTLQDHVILRPRPRFRVLRFRPRP